jgi:hypothetical protein
VAAAVDGNVDEVEAWCAALARRGQFLRVCGTDTWPDGTVASRYGFLHALYRETLYERVPVGRRVRWHQQIGRRLEVGYEPQARERAVELAEHFVSGRDTVRAIKYLHYAGEQAGQRSAHQEALHYLTQGLTLLAPLPETPARIQQELDLQLALGQALSATKGFAAQEVEQTYLRARALCAQVGDTSQLFTTLWCLCRLYHGRGALPTARELGNISYSWPSVRPTRRTAWMPMMRLDTICSTWANTLLPGGTWSRGSPTLTRRRRGPWCCAVAWRLEWCVLAWRPMYYGVWAVPHRPCSGVRKHSPWLKTWVIPIVWRRPSTGPSTCITVVGQRQRCRRWPRPS